MPWLVLSLYFLCLLVIFCYALLQFSLMFNYIKAKRSAETIVFSGEEYLPRVTIQLPLYNEKYVVERLIDTIAEIDYPSELLDIQILDDSTDETTAIIEEKLKDSRFDGVDIKLIRRKERVGFKAGALDYGLNTAKGEFIAIFDADFVPSKDFLKRTIPYFLNGKVGVVQTRWEHLNRNTSLLTKLQAFGLDAHFSVEQVGRNTKNHFINFNGTAGIWRLSTIKDAGGWEHDTLTEDLDLSYRSQLKGWKFVYCEDILSPAELPITISALKSQQFRWIKGGAENFKKMAGRIIKAKEISISNRLHGLGHLFNSTVYIFVFLAALLSMPLVYAASVNSEVSEVLKWMGIFFSSTLLLMGFYWVSFREELKYKWTKLPVFIWRFFQYLTVSLGLSYYNSKGIIEAYRGKKTAFIRTPKFNVKEKKEWKNNEYVLRKISNITLVEGILAVYFAVGIGVSIWFQYYGMIPFQLMLTIGFGLIFIYTLREHK